MLDKSKNFISSHLLVLRAKTRELWVESEDRFSTFGSVVSRCFQMSQCQDNQSDHVPSYTVAADHQAAASYKCLSGLSFLTEEPHLDQCVV